MHGFEERPDRGATGRATGADLLLARMRRGDREAVGEFITIYGERIRRRVRGQLGPGMRRLFDSQEILSTVARRLDELVNAQRLRASEEDQLWALVLSIASNAVVDKARLFERLRRVERDDRAFAHGLLERLEDADRASRFGGEVQIERLLLSVPDPIDRQILEMWLRDVPHVGIAEALGMPSGTVRRRWATIKDALAPRIDRGVV